MFFFKINSHFKQNVLQLGCDLVVDACLAAQADERMDDGWMDYLRYALDMHTFCKKMIFNLA